MIFAKRNNKNKIAKPKQSQKLKTQKEIKEQNKRSTHRVKRK